MAVLQNIRNKAGLLIGIIALALLAFLLGDLLNNGTIGRPDRTIAEINGEDVAIDEYQSRLNELTEVYKMNMGQPALDQQTSERIQDETWNALVRDKIMATEYESTGVTVSSEEVFDMVQGDNVHPLIRQIFANPQTGQVDKAQVINFLKSFDMEGGAQRKAYWLFIEKELRRTRMNEKYNNLIAKGIVTNTADAMTSIEASKMVKNVDFFAVDYTTISDSTVDVSSSDISTYYNAHKENYKQKESRGIEYVSYKIVASSEDDEEVNKWSKKTAAELATEKELVRYVKFNSDDAWDQAYLSESEVPSRLQEFAFNQEIGAVFAPFKEMDTYKVVKLANREMRADSVQVSHIFVQEASAARTAELADSLYNILSSNKKKLAELAGEFSKDQNSAANGGKLGWIKDGENPEEFNTAAFEGKTGVVQKIESQYGTFLLLVTKKSKAVEKVQLATVTRKVEPSNETYRNIYSQASQLRAAGDNYTAFKAEAAKEGVRVRFGNNITRDSKTIMGLQDSKELVRWAYNAEKGDVSDVIELDNQFIVASLSKIGEAGYRAQSEVANQIKMAVTKEKKGEMIAAKINSNVASSKTITSLASKMNTSVKTASDISFSSYSLPQAGAEAKVIGAISEAKVGAISAPIAGARGVYVFKVTSEKANPTAKSIEDEKLAQSQASSYMVNYQAFAALQEKAEVEDNRLQYY